MLNYLSNIIIEKDGSNANIPFDSALERLNIIGIAIKSEGVSEIGVKIISEERLKAGYLELAKGNETKLKLPLTCFDMRTKDAFYFPIHIPANTISTQRSSVMFGEKIAANTKESVEIIFFVEE